MFFLVDPKLNGEPVVTCLSLQWGNQFSVIYAWLVWLAD